MGRGGTVKIERTSWKWLKEELRRLLGEEQAASLWAEYAERSRQDNERQALADAPKRLAYWRRERERLASEGRSTKRVDRTIAEWEERIRNQQS